MTSFPSNKIEPVSLLKEPAIAFNRVDLPAPFPPMTLTKSPSSRVKLISFNACFSLMVFALNVLFRFYLKFKILI